MNNQTSFSFVNLRGDSNENESNAVGGVVHLFTAASTTLLVGDAVYIAGIGIVDKSATASNYAGFAGYVVAGDSNNRRLNDPVGTTAATSGQGVLVQVSGVARAIVGASGFTAGTNFTAVPSGATAGRIIPGTTAGGRVGIPTTTQASAGAEVKVIVTHF
jgi:hypothetical protein